MRRSLAWLVFSVFAVTTTAQETPSTAVWKWTAETVLTAPRVMTAEISPDGKTVVYVRTRPRTATEKPGAAFTNIWIVATAGGEPRRMTFSDVNDATPSFSPDGKTIAFTSARGEGAKRQVWLMAVDGGEPYVLTSAKTGVLAFKWSADGKRIAYTSVEPLTEAEEKDIREGRDWTVKEANEKHSALFVIDVATRATSAVASAKKKSVYEFAWSPDGGSIVANIAETPRMDDSYMNKRTVVLPVDGGELRELANIGGKIGEVAWSPAGDMIAFCAATDRSDPYQGSLFSIPAAGGEPKLLTPQFQGHVMAFAWRKDGTIAALCHEGTKSTVRIFKPTGGESVIAVPKGSAVLSSISVTDDGQTLAAVASAPEHPNEVFVGGFAGEAPKRLTTTTPDLEALPRGKQETITWTAKDGIPIEGVLIYPFNFDPAKKYPLVCCVHGGPEAHESDNWKTTDYIRLGNAAAERGWFILYPNYRASTGRGVEFSKLDHGDLGGKEFDDVVDGIDFLAAKGWVDPKKVGAIGGSYGGYFTAWAVTKLSSRFAAGVEHFGITNWLSFMGQTDIPTENEIVHMAKPFYDTFDLYWDRSPIRWIKNAKTPCLILQGAADDRVPKPQSDELWQALKRNGVPTEYVVYPREPHGYRERAHVIDAFNRGIEWLARYIN